MAYDNFIYVLTYIYLRFIPNQPYKFMKVNLQTVQSKTNEHTCYIISHVEVLDILFSTKTPS